MVDDIHRPEQAEAEIARQEAIRQQELERRLAEAEPVKEVEVGQAATVATRTEGDAMRAQLREQVSVRTVDVEVRIRETERTEMLDMEKATFSQRDVASPTDQQVQEATEALQGIQELRPEVWRGLDDAQRLGVLREVESRMAEIQGRPPVELTVEQMDPGTCGGYDRTEDVISISQEHLRSDKPEEVLDTIVHEGRHAYQHYATEHPGFHPDQAEVEAWEWNMQPGHYLPAEIVGQRAYMQQPVEADAWAYADRIVRNVMGGPQ